MLDILLAPLTLATLNPTTLLPLSDVHASSHTNAHTNAHTTTGPGRDTPVC